MIAILIKALYRMDGTLRLFSIALSNLLVSDSIAVLLLVDFLGIISFKIKFVIFIWCNFLLLFTRLARSGRFVWRVRVLTFIQEAKAAYCLAWRDLRVTKELALTCAGCRQRQIFALKVSIDLSLGRTKLLTELWELTV